MASVGSRRGAPGSAGAEALLGVDGPSRAFDPVKGGPAPAVVADAAAASTGSSSSFPKAARPVVHILTSSSGTGKRREVTVGCRAEGQVFEATTSWSSDVTCPPCRERIGLS